MVRCGDVMLIFLEDVLLLAALPIKELSKQTFKEFYCSVAILQVQHAVSPLTSGLFQSSLRMPVNGWSMECEMSGSKRHSI